MTFISPPLSFLVPLPAPPLQYISCILYSLIISHPLVPYTLWASTSITPGVLCPLTFLLSHPQCPSDHYSLAPVVYHFWCLYPLDPPPLITTGTLYRLAFSCITPGALNPLSSSCITPGAGALYPLFLLLYHPWCPEPPILLLHHPWCWCPVLSIPPPVSPLVP
jgi:hypothetical protein